MRVQSIAIVVLAVCLTGCYNSPVYMPLTGLNYRSNDTKQNSGHSASAPVSSSMDGPAALDLKLPVVGEAPVAQSQTKQATSKPATKKTVVKQPVKEQKYPIWRAK